MTELLPREAALLYLSFGWSVVPLRPREKRPLIRWEIYQKEHPSAEQVEKWFDEHPDANVGVVTGAISGVSCPIQLNLSPAAAVGTFTFAIQAVLFITGSG
jgi:hypothetical protein